MSLKDHGRGLIALVSAFTTWGLLPLYLRFLRGVPPLEIMCHRLVWCAVFALSVLGMRGELASVRAALADAASRKRLAASAVFISINWIVYVWSVSNGRVVEASLGYFVNPIVNVVLGVVVLGERLSRAQWAAVFLAALGVTWIGVNAGAPPFIALALALSFGSYGLLRKTVSVDALVGLGTETLLLMPLGILYLLFIGVTGRAAATSHGPWVVVLLLFGGPLTAVPLALFSWGARRVAYSTVGLVQYIGPTLQLLLGIFLFGERFTPARAAGFSLIWAGLAVYAADGLYKSSRYFAAK